MFDTQSTGTYEANSMQVNIDSTAVAETSLVHCTASDVHCTTNAITTETISVEKTQDNNIPSQSGSVQPECMAAIDKQFGSKGFSKKKLENFFQHHGEKEHKKIMHAISNSSVVGVVQGKLIHTQFL